ncbi:MAG: hypothetical protein HFG63_13665, partial [Lachnospiraceae bacterium]|nr:hypothetical protein [Lachnospiraceae bacterium]
MRKKACGADRPDRLSGNNRKIRLLAAGALTPEHIILNHSTIDLATVGKLSLMSSAIGCTY